MCVSVCVCQSQAMHPDCALVLQHMEALEDCNQILKQEEEESNHSSGTGQSVAVETEVADALLRRRKKSTFEQVAGGVL